MTKRLGSLLTVIPLLIVSLNCSNDNNWRQCTNEAECPEGEQCISGTCVPTTPDDGGTEGGPRPDGDIGYECRSNSDCDGGYCVGGVCCPTEERICGMSCCQTYETCFAQACVVPGDICHSTHDCEEDQYCELSLGDDDAPDGGVDAGADGGDDTLCLHPTPSSGRCLDLPPECPAGTRPDDETTCIPECEYFPGIGPLNAEVRWHWGPDAREIRNSIDVWATPAVGRVTDTNCDGRINELDPPHVIFVSGDTQGTCCQWGELLST